MDNNSKGNYWDWVSAQNIIEYEGEFQLKDLLKSEFPFVREVLKGMFWVECNTIYLNQVFNISQTEIGHILGISQLGVSKRLRSGKKRLQLYFIKPKESLPEVHKELSQYLDKNELQIALLYYQFHNTTVVASIVNTFNNYIKEIVELSIQKLEKHEDTKKYADFLRNISKYETLGEYIFKRDDGERE